MIHAIVLQTFLSLTECNSDHERKAKREEKKREREGR
jgi:hypothetical protein